MNNTSVLEFENVIVKYLKPQFVLEEVRKSNVPEDLKLQLETSDLCSGIYEGGFKVWECSRDLCRYLTTVPNLFQKEKAIRVLDLGCGSGLLGIVSMLLYNIESVCFQDYNEEVLNFWTKPNVRLNGEHLLQKCQFISGSWSNFSNITNLQCDLILTSETIYNPDLYSQLSQCIEKILSDSGIVLLSAKNYYFGCGGSIPSYVEFLKTENVFDCTTVFSQPNASIPRHILEMKRKHREVV